MLYVFGLYTWQNISERNLEKLINIKFCAMISKCASECITIIKLEHDEHALRKSSTVQ